MATRKKTAHCPSCGSRFRKGRYVLRMALDGTRRQRVCQKCAAMATMVLACDAPQTCEQCHKRPARVCVTCIGEILKVQYPPKGRVS